MIGDSFSCVEAGSPTDRAGRTELRRIGDTEYCVTEVIEGAAGSIYTQYAYMMERGGEIIILTFSLQFVQCANYGEPEKTACEQEREAFDPDQLIRQITFLN